MNRGAVTATAAARLEPTAVSDLRALVPAIVAWGTGVWALGWSPWTGLCVGLLLVTGALVVVRRAAAAALTCLVTGLVVLTGALHTWREDSGPVEELARSGSVAHLTATVLAEPIVVGRDGEQRRVLVRVRLESVDARGYHTAVATPVLVRGDERWSDLQWRETVAFTARLRAAQPGSAERAVLAPLGPPAVETRRGPLLAVSDHIRASLRTAVAALPVDARALVPALVVGDTSLTPDELTEAMRATGMSHLSAVSGSNLAILLTAVMAVVVHTRLSRRTRVVIGLVVIAAFIVIARPEPSVLRAAAMGAVGVLAFSRARASAGLPALAATVVVLLVIDPWLARSYGFVLSTLATLGLILFARPWGRAIHRRLPGRERLPLVVGDALAIPVAAHVMTAPVVVLLQGSVSIIGILANLLAAPLVAPATLGGAATALVASIWPSAGAILAWSAALPAWLIARIARWAVTVPGGTLPWPDGAFGALLLAALSVLLIACGPWLLWLARARPTPVATTAALAAALSWPANTVTWPPPDWRVVVCDVGQGDGIVIASGPGRAVVVDTGPEAGAVSPCLSRLDVTRVDAVVLTHFDADHISGLEHLLDQWHVTEILVSPVAEPPEGAAEVSRLADDHRIPLAVLRAGDRLVWEEATATVWWPSRPIHSGSMSNNASVVLAVESGPAPAPGEADQRVQAILLGDIEREAGRAILTRLRREPAWQDFAARLDLVKTPHHGSPNVDEMLVRALPAPLAAVSVGADNDYGHPSPTHLALYRSVGSLVVRTDEVADIALLGPGEQGEVRWYARKKG
ncbi:MBL fold metallo-hydrolase [Nostocoides sp. F2B08]|uniref:ComEC/Rec2 family competence protein n=1 Tax=Nostocoides sp. F2B08 TaxID=2653936 RepID=UPI001263E162|nr:ComEC/Rec2 family competence protein [Tetrasphaera sp. F2B08]KAB7745973.1 MBL fold metallo-hydrolase [Tetrasphaera sp. F2B08]